jgi:Na+/H+-translocating membrane pyrophosphatase
MGILMRILGVLWCLIGLLVTIGAVIGATSEASIEPGMGIAYGVGAVIGASIVLSPIWLTGIVFFLLPGWIRKQLAHSRSDVFS